MKEREKEILENLTLKDEEILRQITLKQAKIMGISIPNKYKVENEYNGELVGIYDKKANQTKMNENFDHMEIKISAGSLTINIEGEPEDTEIIYVKSQEKDGYTIQSATYTNKETGYKMVGLYDHDTECYVGYNIYDKAGKRVDSKNITEQAIERHETDNRSPLNRHASDKILWALQDMLQRNKHRFEPENEVNLKKKNRVSLN